MNPISSSSRRFDAIILGAGISGLVAASILSSQDEEILITDEYNHIGGNHIDISIGSYTFDIGSFIFQDDSPLLDHFPELLPLYVPIDPIWGRLTPQGVVTEYPFSVKDDLATAGPIAWVRIAASVLFARLTRRNPRNARDFANFYMGRYLVHRTGLGYYMERFYGLPSEKIELRFAEKRMLWIKEHANPWKALSLFKPQSRRPLPKNKQLARPHEGYDRLYKVAAEQLRRRGVDIKLGTKIISIDKKDNDFIVNTVDGRLISKRIISTIPITRLKNLLGWSNEESLKSVRLITLFFSFAGRRGFSQSILYNFSHEGAWKRLTVYSDFYGHRNGREYFAVEVNSMAVNNSLEEAASNFQCHMFKQGLFVGDLNIEGSRMTDFAYPIYGDGATQILDETIAELRRFGIESIGRQGAFDYQPTARDSTIKAEVALDFPRKDPH